MRTALILLFLLALAAIPGSVVPQEAVDSVRASQWREQHPQLTPIYEKLGLFSVYDSVWFSAIYILLMVSLVGCIVPRLRVYWRGVRAQPPKAPRNLARLPEHALRDRRGARRRRSSAAARLAEAEALPGRATARPTRRRSRAERGYLREAGNLLFHLSVLVVLVGFAVGGLFGFKGGVIVVTKDGFANTLSQYDDFRAGALFDPADLDAVRLHRQRLRRHLHPRGSRGRDGAQVRRRPDLPHRARRGRAATSRSRSTTRCSVDGTDVFLIGHGYAPHITVRNADGSVAFSGPVVFLPEDSTFRSFGVVKVPDAEPEERPTQLGLEGEFYPTYAFTKASGPFSAFPDDRNPALSMLAYRGDLGLDNGRAAVGLRAAEEEPRARSRRPTASRCASTSRWAAARAARRARHGHLRRGQPLREAPGQPHPGPDGRAGRRGARR